MKKKIVYSVPIFMVIISIITSLIAFDYNKKIENGLIYINDNTSEIVFEGEYYAIIGNLGDNSAFISVESLADHLLITLYDSSEIITKEYTLVVKEENSAYSNSIISDFVGATPVDIDTLEDYILKMNLEKDKTYVTTLTKTLNNIEDEEIDIVLVNVPEHLLNMKNLNESVSFATIVFAALSGFTILVIIFVKKSD